MASSSSSSSSNHSKKQHVQNKSMETEEIVKYMSNLPTYLERGKPVHDRALNFGVLDWGRLEQWQYHHHNPNHNYHKDGVIKTNKCSPAGSISSNVSSLRSYLNIPLEEKTINQSRTKDRSCKKNENIQTTSSSSSSSSKGKMKMQDVLVNEIENIQDSSYGHKTQVVKSAKSEKIHSDLKKDVSKSTPFENETKNKKKSQKEQSSKNKPRKHRFSFSMSCKSEATKTVTKTVESSTVSQNLSKDSEIKEKVKTDHGNSSSSSSRKHARFQMAVKNGRPLFTFTVDDENKETVAATVRSLTAKEDTNSWIYTFFTVHEVKNKKSGLLDHGFVTAQMKVSNPLTTDYTTREFVLSSVESGQPVNQILDVQLEDELAAIVVRFPRKENEEDNDQDCFNMTVILPGGHHSVPRKGEPSPLIQRWRSGGRCDCDGWDVGCRLRTLVNNTQSNTTSNLTESFHLYLQEDAISKISFFSLSMVKEGIFTVDYDSSLPLVHAFSICISVIECRRSCRDSEIRTYVAKQVDYDVAPVTYASLPPVSPVGRV